MEKHAEVDPSSPESLGSTHSGKRIEMTQMSKQTLETHSTTPLSTPLIGSADSGATENLATSVVSELAKLIPGTRLPTSVYTDSCVHLDNSRHGPGHTTVTERGTPAGLLVRDGTGEVTSKAENYQICSGSYARGRMSNSSSSPLSVEMKPTEMLPHSNADPMKVSPDAYVPQSFSEKNLFYSVSMDADDPIKSSWACRELLPPKSTPCALETMHGKSSTATPESGVSQASFAINPNRMHDCSHLEDHQHSHLHHLSDSLTKPDTSNVPFYLDQTWRQYGEPDDHRFHKTKSVSDQSDEFSHALHTKHTGHNSQQPHEHHHSSSSLSNVKRRRRHHYVPQHLPTYGMPEPLPQPHEQQQSEDQYSSVTSQRHHQGLSFDETQLQRHMFTDSTSGPNEISVNRINPPGCSSSSSPSSSSCSSVAPTTTTGEYNLQTSSPHLSQSIHNSNSPVSNTTSKNSSNDTNGTAIVTSAITLNRDSLCGFPTDQFG
ncbi:hypothetical protein AHF37_07456 [Paragonimus kellicotti]|nr:hypothetical protein AHF37_07456 [Paragonimus kellicotti]